MSGKEVLKWNSETVPLTEGDSLGAKRQAGGQAGRNVSARSG
jgi:hypothetical protein